MDRFIECFDTKALSRMIKAATDRLFISITNVHDEIAQEIVNCVENVCDIRLVVDCSEESFRNGYGRTDAIERLKSAGVMIYECRKNRVSFIICDEVGYFIFPESRIFVHDSINNNAVKMDPVTQFLLISYYFPEKKTDGNQEEVQKVFTQSTKKYVEFLEEAKKDAENPKAEVLVEPLIEGEFKKVKENLKKNPPLHPDLQRQINTYTAKIQFAELNFEGANLHVKKISIPPRALPFRDEKIKKALETKMRLFEDLDQKKEFMDFFSVKGKIKDLRKKYCAPITSRKKSVISVERKQEFTAEVEKLKKDIDKLNEIIPQHLDAEILSSKDRIQGELIRFFRENPPEEIKNYQLDLFKRKTTDIVSRILNNIKYPEPAKMLGKMSLNLHFYDLTFEDFKDDNFLKELKERELMAEGDINDIVSFRKAFGTINPQ